LFVQLALAFLKNFFVQQNEEASVAREKADQNSTTWLQKTSKRRSVKAASTKLLSCFEK
jgi:hypothetical protein